MKRKSSIYRIAFIGVMAAMVFAVTYFRFPLLGSQVHFANAFCLLAGLLFGPADGFLAAGLGSALYDLIGAYGPVEAVFTFVNKGLMALVCGKLAGEKPRGRQLIAASAAGAFTYVLLYMAKTALFQHFVYGIAWGPTLAVMGSKLPASLINAVFAALAAPALYGVVGPVVKRVRK